MKITNNKNDDYYNRSNGIIIEDLHDENVISRNNIPCFIDTACYFKKEEIKSNDTSDKNTFVEGGEVLPYEVREKTHDKTGAPIWVVSMTKRLTPKEYDIVNSKVKNQGGGQREPRVRIDVEYVGCDGRLRKRVGSSIRAGLGRVFGWSFEDNPERWLFDTKGSCPKNRLSR